MAKLLSLLPLGALAHLLSDSGISFLQKFADHAKRSGWHKLPLNQSLVQVAQYFLGTAYVAGTLDRDNPNEDLVVNFQELDCVTFLETAIALTFWLRQAAHTEEAYRSQLETWRYAGGRRRGYISRLHYFTDWLHDNAVRGRLVLVPGETCETKPLHVLGDSLKERDLKVQIQVQEKLLSQRRFCFFEKSTMPSIQEGDLIAFVSSLSGIDINHVGFAHFYREDWHFIHASSLSKKVEISSQPLHSYLQKSKRDRGVILARLAD
ncbi:MAG: DUF1460 domain-containing protein [Candidatus Caenarcaniphilales bacterium]|nr:DUF1460 domain-containing protein [Candidatus Caenarcaniphilales bacterium]